MPARVSKTQNEPRPNTANSTRNKRPAPTFRPRSARWGSVEGADDARKRPATRPKPNNPSETYTYVPQPKFRFVPDEAYVVAGAGATMHAYRNPKTRKDYRTLCPEESGAPSSTVSEGAKSMLNYFLQSYAAECGAYARLVREGANTGRINSEMMEVGMEMAGSKVFGAANHCKHLFAPTAEKQPSDAAKSKSPRRRRSRRLARPSPTRPKKAPKDKSAGRRRRHPRRRRRRRRRRRPTWSSRIERVRVAAIGERAIAKRRCGTPNLCREKARPQQQHGDGRRRRAWRPRVAQLVGAAANARSLDVGRVAL